MKKTTSILLFIVFICSLNIEVNAQQTNKKTYITYSRPAWVIGIGPAWELATNDAYGRANYKSNAQVWDDNYGMRWGIGGYLYGKYSPWKTKVDRIFLGVDVKGMTNSDFSDYNKTSFNMVSIDAGYEYLFYGNYRFRSYYGLGLTGNFISGDFTPGPDTTFNNVAKSFESTFRMGMEIKAGLEFVVNNSKRNIGINVGGKYNLTNLFSSDNAVTPVGQTSNLSLNDGSGDGGPGFKRYIGIFSLEVGINIYPDVKVTKVR